MENAAITEELQRPARKSYAPCRVVVRGLDESWQADLMDMSTYAWYNNGYKYLLTIIDIFLKYAWVVPTKTKSGKDVTDAMNSVLKRGRVPRKLHVDQGKEFHNSELKALM